MLVGDCTMGFLISHPVCQYSVTPGIAHARSETEVMTSFSRSGHPPDCRTEETASLGQSPYVLKVLSRYVASDKTEW
jgi:methyl coenzyme M reductase subunit C